MQYENFCDKVAAGFGKVIGEIEKGESEDNLRYRFVKYLLEDVLGYESRQIKWEKKRADLTIVDENNFPVLKIETKKPSENIDRPEIEEQAFKYLEDTTEFIGLTNFTRFKLWKTMGGKKEIKVDVDFTNLKAGKVPAEQKARLLFFENIGKENLFAPSKYKEFNSTYARIDITKESGFSRLLERMNYISNNLLLEYTLRAFGEYKEGYSKYIAEKTRLDEESKNGKKSSDVSNGIARYKQKVEEQYRKYATFSGYYLWKEYSGKESLPDEQARETFCKETIYVLLDKLLFIRICEDKGLIEKNISNGGIEELRSFLAKRFGEDAINKEILEMAFKTAGGIYPHFYETGILDWFKTGDGELNTLLNKVLWILNQFHFAHVDRDILGNLYEKYLPGAERKKLGEFYTPTEVIDYILTAVGYTYNNEIDNQELLDPACGSGGFIVRATRRLISRWLVKFGKAEKAELREPKNWKEIISRLSPDEAKIVLESVKQNIYGLDINPFACHIAEMNMVFQVIDLYQKAKEKHKDYKIGRFKIYRTDSLEKPNQKRLTDYAYQSFLEEQNQIEEIKNKKFDYVVGNPPYVRVQMMEEKTKEYIKRNYKTPIGKFDVYIPFIERGIDWLKDNSKLGFINPNLFLNRDYGNGLRIFLIENTILQIIDFGDSGVFKNVTNYPCIIVVQKKKPEKNKIKTVIVHRPKEQLLYDVQKKFYQKYHEDEYFSLFDIEQDKLGKEQWKLIPEILLKVFNKIKVSSDKTLSYLAELIYEGFITGDNKIYFVSREKAKNLKLERNLLKSVPKGRDVKRWGFSTDQFVIYPHIDINGKTVVIENLKSEYPNTWQYFKDKETKLRKRKYLMDAIKKGGRKEWFEIWNPRSYAWFNQPKIITPNLSTENNFAFDEDGVFLDHDCYGIIFKDKKRDTYLYALGLLNSRVLEFYLKQISPYASGKYYRYMTSYLEKLPIKLPETAAEKKLAEKVVECVEEILEHYKKDRIDIRQTLEGQETQELYSLNVKFSIRENAKFGKIEVKEDKIFLNKEDFVQVKDAAIRKYVVAYLNAIAREMKKTKILKGIIYGLPVPKSEAALKSIGSAADAESESISVKLEDEINNAVYKLYGITDEERKVIEGSLGK